MCGLTAILGHDSQNAVNIISMTDTQYHRGPDSSGFFVDKDIAFGHRRLSILDVANGHQPFIYQNKYVITYNGEIYNFIELRRQLIDIGYKFNTETDTEVILASFDHWGPDCVTHFNGMWSFIIYELDSEKIFISRDRFGIKPLFFSYFNNLLLFASEIKAIISYPYLSVKPDYDSLDNFFVNGASSFESRTSFANISRFPSAHYYYGNTADFSTDRLTRYWSLNINRSKEKYCENRASLISQKYFCLLKDSVALRLRSDVMSGSALSGGLDSSSIVYLVNRLLHNDKIADKQKTFSSIYSSSPALSSCDESSFINEISSFLDVENFQVEPSFNFFFDHYHKLLYHLENPPDSTCVSGWHVYQLINENNVIVTLDGQGADELLAGYDYYIPYYISSLPFFDQLREIISFSKTKGLRFIFSRLFFKSYLRLHVRRAKYIFKKYFLSSNEQQEFSLNDLLYETFSTSLLNLLDYGDKESMAFSVESRLPFLDYRIVEFLFSVPACYKIHNGWSKYLARKAFSNKLPSSICWRSDKIGWAIPEDFWFKNYLRDWLKNEVQKSPLANKILSRYSLNLSTLSKQKLVRLLNIAVFDQVFFNSGDNEYEHK